MNALPVEPQQVTNPDLRTKYFDELDRLGFDIAWNGCHAIPYDDVVDKFKDVYSEFAAEAGRRGYSACIQIPSTICAGNRVGVEEAQYDLENNPIKWRGGAFVASFASDVWREHVKELTSIFIEKYGFDHVVFSEPLFPVDIPGTRDRFHEKFMATYPDAKYPEARAESTDYLRVQQAKADVVVDYYRDLAAHAKSVGAAKVGVMVSSFIPTTENTPEGTLNTSCDIGRISQIADVDFLVAHTQPAGIARGNMRTGDEMANSPAISYVETLAQALGKDVMALNSPIIDEAGKSKDSLIPYDFYGRATISCLAAAPCGFVGTYCVGGDLKDTDHTKLLIDAAACVNRLGRPKSPVAFVYSYSGTRHAEPLTYETSFRYYWDFVKRMDFEAHLPAIIFYADTFERDLAEHPEVQVLVFEEHFPLTMDQIIAIRSWWQGYGKKAMIAFGSGEGFSADVDAPGVMPCAASLPGVLELIGLKQEEPRQVVFGEPTAIRDVSRVRRSAFLGENPSMMVSKIANVRRVFGSRANVLYDVEVDDTRVPVVAEWRDRATLALFCGFGLSEETAPAVEMAIRYALREVDYQNPIIDDCSDGIIWNTNVNDYVVMSNVSDKIATAVGKPGRANFWDCRAQKMLPDNDQTFTLEPNTFQMYRVIGRRSKFFDVLGVVCFRKLIDGAGRAEIEINAGRRTTFILRNSPKEIYVDGRPCPITQEVVDDAYYVTLQKCQPGERRITLKW